MDAVEQTVPSAEPYPKRDILHRSGVEWLTAGRFSLVLGLFIAAAFPQVVFGLQTFVVRDFGFFAYPLAHFQRQCFWRGELPFWNPYNNCGIPFLAQWNTMPLYPPALIYLLFPLSWSLGFFCLLHMWWAGLGMYFLAHRWTNNRLAASVAGLVFAFNGMSLNLLMWPSHIATFSWMAWVVWSVERAWQTGGRRLVIAAACGACQMLAGGPETILLTWLFLTALWVTQLARQIWSGKASLAEGANTPATPSSISAPRAMFWRFPLVVLLVAGIAAAQLLPFLDLVAHSQREQGYADTRWSMPAWGWANYFVPMVFGQVWTMGVFFQHGQAWTSSYYVGVGALLLAVLAIKGARSSPKVLLVLATALALGLAPGEQSIVYRVVHRLIPQLTMMTYPVKFLLVVTFTFPLLSGFAVERFQKPNRGNAVQKYLIYLSAIFLCLIGAILIWAWHWPMPGDNFSDTLWNGATRAFFLILTAALLYMLQRFARSSMETTESSSSPGFFERFKRFEPLIPLLLLLVLWVDVWTHEPSQNPTVAPVVYTPNLARIRLEMHPQPALGESRAMLTASAEEKFRSFIVSSPRDNFLVKRVGYFADCNDLDEVPKVDGFFSLYPRECGELGSVLYGSTNASFPRLADFMSVSQMTAPGEFFKWSPRESFLPLATIGQKPFYFEGKELLFAVLATNFDGRTIVCLPKELEHEVIVTNRTRAEVVSSRFDNQKVQVVVDAAEPSILVLAQTFYHSWQALVDGKPAPLLRANYAFQAVQVPTGRHQVQFAYRDRAFFRGAAISIAAILGCFIIWVTCRKTSSDSSSPP